MISYYSQTNSIMKIPTTYRSLIFQKMWKNNLLGFFNKYMKTMFKIANKKGQTDVKKKTKT